ncbi:hypothetical protein Sjap_008265 [Stephania japonica]|uniref:Uncharacterized protein n=1 Tax=Stephania japonica TaxID=461633 RepID=A0AAP0JPZ1_9MAGN
MATKTRIPMNPELVRVIDWYFEMKDVSHQRKKKGLFKSRAPVVSNHRQKFSLKPKSYFCSRASQSLKSFILLSSFFFHCFLSLCDSKVIIHCFLLFYFFQCWGLIKSLKPYFWC